MIKELFGARTTARSPGKGLVPGSPGLELWPGQNVHRAGSSGVRETSVSVNIHKIARALGVSVKKFF